MPATVTVLYPAGIKFDMEYYLTKHMPLVQEKWSKDGLTGWKVIKFADDAPHSVGALLEWGSQSEFQSAASGPDAGEVLGDIKNFTDGQPVIFGGDVVKTS